MGKEDGGGIPLPRFTFLRGEETAVRNLARDLDQKTSHLVFDLNEVISNSILSDIFMQLDFSPIVGKLHSIFKEQFGDSYRIEAFKRAFFDFAPAQNSLIFLNYEEDEVHYLYSKVKYHNLIEIEIDEVRKEETPWLSFQLKTNPEHSTLYILESCMIRDFPGKERLQLYDG